MSTNPNNNLQEKSTHLLQGTIIGLAARWITWPLEKAYYDKSMSFAKSYHVIYSQLFNWQHFKKLNHSFWETGVVQTIGKSFSSMGVVTYLDQYHPALTPVQRGYYSGFIGAPIETLATSRGEFRKIKRFSLLQMNQHSPLQTQNMISKEFARMVSVSYVRNFWSSLITFGGVYKTKELITPYFSTKNNSAIDALSGAIAGFAAQPIIMPINNLQTYVANNPTKNFSEIAKDFFGKNKLQNMFAGALGRSVCQSLRYSLNFFLINQINKKSTDPKIENSKKLEKIK